MKDPNDFMVRAPKDGIDALLAERDALAAELDDVVELSEMRLVRIRELEGALREILDIAKKTKQRYQGALLEVGHMAVVALESTASETFVKPEPEVVNEYTHPFTAKCCKCGTVVRLKEPCKATVFYCSYACT